MPRPRASTKLAPTTKEGAVAGFDYGVIVIGSGFSGAGAAMRAAEMEYSVAVLEAGNCWAMETAEWVDLDSRTPESKPRGGDR